MSTLTLESIMSRANAQNLESITTLNLWGMKLSDISILSKLPLLETVSLSKNEIKDISIFKTMKSIKELYLADNQISDLNQIDNLKNCKKIEKLVLKGNPIYSNPNYIKKVLEILPHLMKLDEKDSKTLKKEINDLPFKKNKAQKINGTNNKVYKNKSPGLKKSDKNENKGNLAAPEPGAINQNQNNDNNKENGNENINSINNINNNCGIVDPEIGNPKISAKTLEIFNKSFKKKKTEGTFFKLRRKNINRKINPSNTNIDSNLNDLAINENNNALNESRIEDDERFKTLPTSLSVRMFTNDINPNKRNWYKKKIIGNYKNDASKLNQSTYLKYKQFDNEEEEEKRKEDSKEKNLNRSFYQRLNTQTYNKKICDKKENSFTINNNSNSGNNNNKIIKKVEEEENDNKEKNKKIMKSIQLLIGTLSSDGLKEVQSEIQKLLSNLKK